VVESERRNGLTVGRRLALLTKDDWQEVERINASPEAGTNYAERFLLLRALAEVQAERDQLFVHRAALAAQPDAKGGTMLSNEETQRLLGSEPPIPASPSLFDRPTPKPRTSLDDLSLRLCYAIEEAGASEALTKCTVLASELRRAILAAAQPDAGVGEGR
jgi:hypothetical protein